MHFVINFKECVEVNSYGVSVLINLIGLINGKNGKLIFTNVDAQVSYILSEYNMLFKLSINNLLGQYYNTSVVTPKIGSTFYLSIDYDGLIK